MTEAILERVITEIEVKGFDDFGPAAKGAKSLATSLGTLDRRLVKIDKTLGSGQQSITKYISALVHLDNKEDAATKAAMAHTKAMAEQEKQAKRTAKSLRDVAAAEAAPRRRRGSSPSPASSPIKDAGLTEVIGGKPEAAKKATLDLGVLATAFRDTGGAGEDLGNVVDVLSLGSLGGLGVAVVGVTASIGLMVASFSVAASIFERGSAAIRASNEETAQSYERLGAAIDQGAATLVETAIGSGQLGEHYKTLAIGIELVADAQERANNGAKESDFDAREVGALTDLAGDVLLLTDVGRAVNSVVISMDELTKAREEGEKAQEAQALALIEADEARLAEIERINEQIASQEAAIGAYGNVDGAIAHSLDFHFEMIDALEAKRAKLVQVHSGLSGAIPLLLRIGGAADSAASSFKTAAREAGSFFDELFTKIQDGFKEATKKPTRGAGGGGGDPLKDIKAAVAAEAKARGELRATNAAIEAGSTAMEKRLDKLQTSYADTTAEIEAYTHALREAEKAGKRRTAKAAGGKLDELKRERTALQGEIDLLNQRKAAADRDTSAVAFIEAETARLPPGPDPLLGDEGDFDASAFTEQGLLELGLVQASIDGQQLSEDWAAASEAAKEYAEVQNQITADAMILHDVSGLVAQGLANVAHEMTAVVGAWIVGEGKLADFGDATLDAFGSLASQLSQFFVATGTAMLFIPGLEVRGAAAIGAGLALGLTGGALTALGSANKSSKSKSKRSRDADIDEAISTLRPRKEREQRTTNIRVTVLDTDIRDPLIEFIRDLFDQNQLDPR